MPVLMREGGIRFHGKSDDFNRRTDSIDVSGAALVRLVLAHA